MNGEEVDARTRAAWWRCTDDFRERPPRRRCGGAPVYLIFHDAEKVSNEANLVIACDQGLEGGSVTPSLHSVGACRVPQAPSPVDRFRFGR